MRDLADWMLSVGLGDYTERFVEQEITLDLLPHLTEDDIDRLGLPVGSRRRLVMAIRELASSSIDPPLPGRDDPGPSSGSAERRQLTVGFCDLVGSTALSERLDPEELHELMHAYRAACADVVTRYDGHVAQYLGDGVMMYFGWPRAHEDDAERAVRAALDIVRAVHEIRTSPPLNVRIGIATGPVVIGETAAAGTDDPDARLAIGETPNLAARLQALAGVNEVVITSMVRRLVAETFSLTDLGKHPLKGIAEPVSIWRVEAERRTLGRFKAAHGSTGLVPLVGREKERSLLERRWQQACAGDGQVVLVGGQAGIGKSRLAQGLREGITEPHTVLHYQCSPYHLNSPLYPFIEQFEGFAGFAPADTPEERRQKMQTALRGPAVQVAEAAPLFANLLSLPAESYDPPSLSPRKHKEKTLLAMLGQIEAMAREGPVLMVVEDIHWVDPTSQALLELVVPRLRRLPVLTLMTYRLEFVPPWAGQPNVSTLTLSGLNQRQGGQLVRSVTRGRMLPGKVLDAILERTDGVPLFVEELTRSVLESGLLREDEEGDGYRLEGPLTALAIPASLRGSLMARLDRLGAAKNVAQIGACLGREFSRELLERVASSSRQSLDASLQRLVEAGLLTERASSQNTVYTFRHALVQDTAYDSLLKKRRRQLHARIADMLSTEFSERAINRPETLAHHYTQAGHPDTAIPLWRTAGTIAVERVALREAVAYFENGLALIGELPPSTERDALELTIREPLNAAWTGLQGWAAPEVDENAASILRLVESQGNTARLPLAIWWVWTTTITQGRIEDSLPWAERLLAEGEKADDIDLRIFGHTTAMVQCFLSGRLEDCHAQAECALALYDPQLSERWIQLTGHDLRTFVEVYFCQALWMKGLPEQAVQLSETSCAHARATGHAFSLVWALTFSAYVFAYRREPERLLERVAEADRLARDQGLAFIYEVSVPQARGLAELQRGNPRQAIALLREGIERWTEGGGNVRIPFVKTALAQAVAREGDAGTALELIDECLEQIERPGWQERLWLAEVLRVKGWVLTQEGEDDEAESVLRAAIDCARQQRARSWELRAVTTLATLLARQNRTVDAADLLAPAVRECSEGHDTRDWIDANALLSKLS